MQANIIRKAASRWPLHRLVGVWEVVLRAFTVTVLSDEDTLGPENSGRTSSSGLVLDCDIETFKRLCETVVGTLDRKCPEPDPGTSGKPSITSSQEGNHCVGGVTTVSGIRSSTKYNSTQISINNNHIFNRGSRFQSIHFIVFGQAVVVRAFAPLVGCPDCVHLGTINNVLQEITSKL